jgi:flavodoxin I
MIFGGRGSAAATGVHPAKFGTGKKEARIMKTLVVYDSIFGNTEKIAHAIGAAIPGAEVVRAEDARTIPEGTGLLIVGSPTRAFQATAAVKKFLAGIPARGLAGVQTAAFDTRISLQDADSRVLDFLVPIFGYAAIHIAGSLKKKGSAPALPPEGFFVQASEGPLKDGELDRAADWARRVRQLA